MILYAESSAVLRWLFNDTRGDEVLDHLRRARKVVASRLTVIECRRAARRAVGEARLTESQLGDVLAVLAQSTARWAVLDVTPEVADRAGGRFPAEPVWTLAAIHLASMSILRESLPELAVLSTDDRMRANSVQLGFEVLPVTDG